jgi:hypothetical protein
MEQLMMELCGTQFKMASHPLLEIGNTGCLALAHYDMVSKVVNARYRGGWPSTLCDLLDSEPGDQSQCRALAMH